MPTHLNNPKTWAAAAGVFGIALILSGMMTQWDTKKDPKTQKCETSPWNIVTIVLGFILLIACFMSLHGGGKKATAIGAGGTMMDSGLSEAASVSPQPTPPSMEGMAMP